MPQCPRIVAEYLECGAVTEYDVVQLLAALDFKETHQSVDYGNTTAVIRYQIPYLINNIPPLVIFFALGNDIALRNVLSIPCLLAMGEIVGVLKVKLKCSELNKEFSLQLIPQGKGLPDGTNFDTSFTKVSDSVSSNVTPLSSFFLYTSSDDTITPVSRQNYSNNLVVTGHSFQGCISRDLVYHPPTNNASE